MGKPLVKNVRNRLSKARADKRKMENEAKTPRVDFIQRQMKHRCLTVVTRRMCGSPFKFVNGIIITISHAINTQGNPRPFASIYSRRQTRRGYRMTSQKHIYDMNMEIMGCDLFKNWITHFLLSTPLIFYDPRSLFLATFSLVSFRFPEPFECNAQNGLTLCPCRSGPKEKRRTQSTKENIISNFSCIPAPRRAWFSYRFLDRRRRVCWCWKPSTRSIARVVCVCVYARYGAADVI